ncbi:GerMN domain-containing protein [Granulicella aggregans]|uniref:GerMN domain-containing protein n=1 Tax=Granulicella aggregans TaxID=474949 RepID=UPI0021E015D2|nr:GerMN domain-containing protein [Granulicella aggregans]
MIPRYQRVLFYGLLASIVLMALFLFYERERVRKRWLVKADSTPLTAPAHASETSVIFDLASDRDGTITAVQRQLALPDEASVRARALLDRLMAEYALPRSDHPLAGGAAVDDVFLVRLPMAGDTTATDESGEMAVVNLRGSFIDQHPSGVETEMLSLLSMLGTLHANFPEIATVRFVVDGKTRETIAGHVDLSRLYPALDTPAAPADLQPAP